MTSSLLTNLGLDPGAVREWFAVEATNPFLTVRVSRERAASLGTVLALPVRRCYVGDVTLEVRRAATGRTLAELISARLPDPGSTMAGDFGEILACIFLAADRHPAEPLGPLRWQLKQDRTKPAPHSDVLLFIMPACPASTESDVLICAEVKTKSTPGASAPISDALRDSNKDRTSRLARTLQWLRERALLETVEGISLEILDRFAYTSDHPPAVRQYVAVAVLSDAVEAAELATVPNPLPPESALAVLVVPDLHETYSSVYSAAASANPPQSAA